MKSESHKEEYENFAHNVVWLRKSYGLSKKKMAEIMGIGIGSLNKVEMGEIPPRLKVEALINIYSRFGISPEKQLSKRLGDEEERV